ncbi:hypothetical protein M514_20869 [Trichuris suis]|uniref:Uncharacterized protein n=2 Tax=Trichuris suis TaxID=68888 RepID=A0A085NC07_9BILA|nr:hypothetical protein M514_20869 [Trichuris suis]KHJ40351.1 hypothetical protein D918_09597 [Trichuris suis]
MFPKALLITVSADTLLKKFWQLNAIGASDVTDALDLSSRIMEKFEESLTFDGQRYQVRLPWKTEKNLPNNFQYAMKRKQTEKRVRKKSTDAHLYTKAMQEYLSNDWVEAVTDHVAITGSEWYLSLHAVIRNDKAATNYRIVFDGSACYQGMSLNDQLETGPTLQKDLVGILIRFRFL